MKQRKYITSGGLAFSEDKDMEKLHRFSLKGWHVSDFKFMGYTLEKGERSDYIYSVDYCSINESEEEEYFDLFSSAGWTHVTSEGDIHLFRASPDTKPIHSECETVAEKHDNLGGSMRWSAISLILITALVWLGTFLSTGSLQMILAVIAVIFTMIAFPAAWTVITIYTNKSKAKGNGGLVNLTKTLPIIFPVLFAVIILLIFGSSGNAGRILASMVIGGIALPTVIWVVMSLYHKLRGT
ncbi:MAG TPA: DUF2812 domain-containing protein [Candidatus Avamphibacillus sp.]|nr:DUF2812 domain-containing protein [Candidatus Avamphibacillus sp.]